LRPRRRRVFRLAAGPAPDAGKLIPDLTKIRAATGVAIIVVPQNVEGSYGYLGARRLLGSRLATSHVLDIGGGSLQIAGEHSSFGDAIGQKLWHQQVCQALGRPGALPCSLSPMTNEELATVRALLARRLENVRATLRGPVTMTAISRPVTHGVAPAVERLLEQSPGQAAVSASDLGRAISQVAGMTLEHTASRLGIAPGYAAYLLSDMLLVEGLMQATGAAEVQVAEVDLTNVPGLLADDTAYRWADNYGCYLLRLARDGLDAYASDPASCYRRSPAAMLKR
jgi:exopolyphosphatase/pppGpp-phosphohydrolase